MWHILGNSTADDRGEVPMIIQLLTRSLDIFNAQPRMSGSMYFGVSRGEVYLKLVRVELVVDRQPSRTESHEMTRPRRWNLWKDCLMAPEEDGYISITFRKVWGHAFLNVAACKAQLWSPELLPVSASHSGPPALPELRASL